jgi:hypothetical protein
VKVATKKKPQSGTALFAQLDLQIIMQPAMVERQQNMPA